MDLEDISPASDVRKRNLDVTIKSAGSEESGVKGIQSVGGSKNNYLSKVTRKFDIFLNIQYIQLTNLRP